MYEYHQNFSGLRELALSNILSHHGLLCQSTINRPADEFHQSWDRSEECWILHKTLSARVFAVAHDQLTLLLESSWRGLKYGT